MIATPRIKWKGAHPSNFRAGRIPDLSSGVPFKPQLIVVHVMDGSLFGSTTEILSQLPQGLQKSWHYAIGWDWANRAKVGLIDPEIFQHVHVEDTAFHAGTLGKNPTSAIVRKMQQEASQEKRVINANDYSIGIECHGTKSVWHKRLTPTLVHLIAWLCETHGLKASRDTIVGHYEIDADRRKECPGRNCNLNQIVRDVQVMLAL